MTGVLLAGHLLIEGRRRKTKYGLDDGFHETGINEASEHGTGRMLVDSWFQNI
jgi:hypothetical protein